MRYTVLAVAMAVGLASVSEAQVSGFKWIGCSGVGCPKDSSKAPAAREPAITPVATQPATAPPASPDTTLTQPDSASPSSSRAPSGRPFNRPSGVSTRRVVLSALNDRFATAQACLTALASGSARYYQPTYFRPKSLARGERVLPLEHDACVDMKIVRGRAWVPQAQGTKVVFNGTTPIRRADCGNDIYGIVYPQASPPSVRKDTVFIDSTVVVRRDLVDERLVEMPVPKISGPNWWSRNWMWALPLGLVAGGAGTCIALHNFSDYSCFPREDRVEVDVTQAVQFLRALRR